MKPEHNPYYDQKTLFVTGFAGSGKSTHLADRVKNNEMVLVPTHKAAEVLHNKGIENVFTIHSVLKLVPSINEDFKKKLTTRLKQIGTVDLSKIKVIYIDEFSMINEEILNMLMALLPAEADIILYGDPFQLKPVTGEAIQPWEPILELTTQHRSKNPRGTELFMKFMEAIKDYRASPEIPMVIDSNWVKSFDPETDRILAFTNKRVVELNKMVSGNKEFKVGDELIMNGIPATLSLPNYVGKLYPSCIVKGKLLDSKKLGVAVQKANNDIDKWHTQLGMYPQTSISVEGTTYTIYYDPNHYQTEQKLKKDVEKYQKLVISENKLSLKDNIPNWCRDNRGGAYVRERGKAWSKYLAHKGYVFNLAYPHATTVHKAQGQEFSTVFIDQRDMAKALSTEQYQRLMYVALSRAINKIVFI